ncbi:PUA-like domain-containing protein [Blyttiomyces helicus]|uniref:PUA-like domain-containing protein n=1 Tax=Blyttiomyces helicus TaxID=388810 RepID=A0A4V1IQS7_9FUNG|nr:PUA-like domain-containing protein [Blyttiomyces helicus]|eukprot:RKO87597.1 PUA-like domain-containing protein [Blyttiomyces helicus]
MFCRPTVAGISGDANGAYSVAVSGGYEDDVDLGEAFTFTGSGGRDLKGTPGNRKNLRTAPQSKDQTLEGVNKSLHRSFESGNPVRVIRGYKGQLGPETGYRYDGLYKIEKAWPETGLAGFLVWKFAFKRMAGQDPLPFDAPPLEDQVAEGSGKNDETARDGEFEE